MLSDTSNNLDGPRIPSGIGGWLLLPIAGLFYSIYAGCEFLISGGLSFFFESVFWVALITPGTPFYRSLWGGAIIVVVLIQVVIVIAALFSIIAIFRKKRYAKKLIIMTYVIGFFLVTMDYVIIRFFLLEINIEIANEAESTSLWQGIKYIISSAIWVPYFLTSKRVKNTFTT